ncbi:ABC transporter substrate-binding protein [Desulfurococcus amylolyticus]|uniref:Extracellular solute-binding protein family 5 n=1 Tax=Desulfurococcus amylolyticus DSM 16532 TaxID=768672 RepID=I3XRI4_DESAM|nr:ABC transporter substrate-binding protein [Desulfurococcus amylolyticus]AFL66558.1 extracellular solute-binding protein family 5 [Desulfurococcus amylolyticus DSM 16532]
MSKALSRTVAILLILIVVIAIGIGAYYWSSMQQPTQVIKPTKPIHTQVLYLISNDENTRIQLYQSGTVDIAAVTPSRWRDINNTPVGNFKLVLAFDPSRPMLTIQHVILNTMREPFNITEVRQALAWATPYQAILDQVFSGLYTRLYTIVPKGLQGYTEYNIVKYEYNLTKAMEIIDQLKQRGFDPSKYTIEIAYNQGNTARQQIAAMLQNAWSQLGFRVIVNTYNWPQYLDKVDNFNFDVALLGWIPDYLDPDNYLMPFVWGGAEFTEINYYKASSPNDVSNYVSRVERVIDTEKYIVVVGPKGSGASYTGPANKPILVVNYVLDEEATMKNWEKPVSMVTIGAPGWKDIPVSALVKISRTVLDPDIREAVINAAVIVFNNESPMIMLGQQVGERNYGSWVYNMYYPLSAFARYDLMWEDPNAPVVDTGVSGIRNDPNTMVIATIGWPDTFDPAKSYESFGWEIFWQIYSRPITYYYENTEPEPELAVAWAFSSDATDLYLVIRGGVQAYDPWNNKTYPIDATDVLFSIWRVARTNLPGGPSWMVSDFIDVNASQVLTEDEFKQVVSNGLSTVYHGQSKTVKSLDELLGFFNYSGQTAGVVKLKLKFPYPPILHVLTTAVGCVIPMEYALGNQYQQALADSNNGKNPAAWAKYVLEGEDDPTYKLLKDKPVSTGPYYVADYKEDSYILLKLNPYYWNATVWYELYGFKP